MDASQHHEDQPVVNIVGEKVALGPIRRDLLPVYQRWNNDVEVLILEEAVASPSTAEATERWYEEAARDDRSIIFTVYERATWHPIGRSALHDVDHHNRTATFSIGLDEKDCWGKGYGTETTRLVLEYGFTNLGLHNIMLFVYSFNERALHVYQRVGFREVGRRREAVRLGGRAYDVIYMDCLATDFRF